jgi:hypothetical protein
LKKLVVAVEEVFDPICPENIFLWQMKDNLSVDVENRKIDSGGKREWKRLKDFLRKKTV